MAHAYNYKDLDPIKSRNLYSYLIPFLKEQGKEEEADRLYSEWNRRFPERLQSLQLRDLLNARHYSEVKVIALHLLQQNPLLHDVWGNLGLAYANLGLLDSAISCCRISLALNPGNPAVLSDLAGVRIMQGRLDEATNLLDRAIAIDSTRSILFFQKAQIARIRRQRGLYIKNLTAAASRPDAQPAMSTPRVDSDETASR